MKHCPKCNITKPKTEFVGDKRRKDGHYPYCKQCSKQYYDEKRLQILAQKKEYNSRPEIVAKRIPYDHRRYDIAKDVYAQRRHDYYSQVDNRRKLMLWKSKERAGIEGWEFNLELEDIIIPEFCPYLEIKLTHDLGRGQLETNSSIDRIDSSKGYIKGNVQIISRLANTMKSNATLNNLKIFAKNVLIKH